MVEKFYAYYKGKKINIYEGLKLKKDKVIATNPASRAELFDSLSLTDRYPLRPCTGRLKKDNQRGLPFYAYYSGYKPEGNNLEGSGGGITLAHAVFQDIFSNLSEFTIEYRKEIIMLFIDKVTVNLRVKDEEENYYVVEIMYDLEKTFPYSYYYKWNGLLAMEIVVTTEVTKEKVDFLSSRGIQVCELKVPRKIEAELRNAQRNSQDDFTGDFPFEDVYNKNYQKYYYLFESNKFRAFVNLPGDVQTKFEWREIYTKMKNYEQQETEMIENIKEKKEELEKLQIEQQNLLFDVEKLRKQKGDFLERDKKLEGLSALVFQLSEENKQLEQKINSVLVKNKELKKQNLEWENQPLTKKIKRIFDKKLN
ncbi:hypothetical protein JKN33_001456 [Enterococcus faecalis]|nr:hypothetical protein [Enterococcus faecalis]EGO6046882.1 hypothetical protein [Enterococcus faecalis]EGO8019416.1 hypothetical protein [Enterococcus faecalis]EGO8539712.1 hypothetical protein [Enterococcus faecalis]EGO9799222.1 hypothetical protein [Enterococcus faecalis]